MGLDFKHSKHSIFKSFGFALDGFKVAFFTGRNFRIQVGFGIMAILLAITLNISVQEWIDIVLIIAVVLILELINTSIESVVDMISPEISDLAKIAKDVSAASVLVASFASVAIGIFIFLPKILQF
jgi:diacylglycerol kinase